MDDLGIIDQFVKTFSDYIESGFGLIDADAVSYTHLTLPTKA